jgi:uncharacterized protein
MGSRLLRSARLGLLILVLPPAASVTLAKPVAAGPPTSLADTLPFTSYVVDQAGVLTREERRRLIDRLGRFQRETGHQMAVATVDSLAGEQVAAFSLRLATRWGVGRKDANDGILILLAPQDRSARIEVGLGLEQRLTNAFCATVMSGHMVPEFAQGRYGSGLERGVTAIIAKLASNRAEPNARRR